MPIAALLLPLITLQGPMGDLAKPQEGKSMRVSSTFRGGKDGKYDSTAFPTSDLLEHSNSDNFRVQPGKTHVLMDVKGPGAITHMWITFLGPEIQNWAPKGSANHRDLLLRIYYDGNPRPAVEAPVGDFFANCFGRRDEVISLPVLVEDADSYNCFWNMPFRKSCKIEIVNQSDLNVNLLYYNIDWIQKPIAKAAPYFYAQYRQEYPAVHGRDYVILDTKGKGHYVGTVLSVRTRSPQWFGEGDEKVYIDGESVASIQGTGTEDYFLSAWGLKKVLTPYFGVPYFDQWGIVGGHTSAYRWHINDPLVFQKGIKVAIEHFGWMSTDENPEHKENSWNEREDDYASVAFWYQTGQPTFEERAPAIRKLPNIDRVIAYGRDVETHGLGTTQKQQLDLFDGPQLLYMPPSEVMEAKTARNPAFVEIPFEITKKEPLRLLLSMTTSYDFGIYQAYLVGPGEQGPVKLGGPMDFYSKSVDSREFHLLDFWPEPGKYKLRLDCVSKAPESRGYFCGLESVRLRERRPRVTQFGWDKDKDWRKNPTLY
jgi:hypothetical protein